MGVIEYDDGLALKCVQRYLGIVYVFIIGLLILSRIILLLILLNILVAALMYKSESLMQALFSSLMVTGKVF